MTRLSEEQIAKLTDRCQHNCLDNILDEMEKLGFHPAGDIVVSGALKNLLLHAIKGIIEDVHGKQVSGYRSEV